MLRFCCCTEKWDWSQDVLGNPLVMWIVVKVLVSNIKHWRCQNITAGYAWPWTSMTHANGWCNSHYNLKRSIRSEIWVFVQCCLSQVTICSRSHANSCRWCHDGYVCCLLSPDRSSEWNCGSDVNPFGCPSCHVCPYYMTVCVEEGVATA